MTFDPHQHHRRSVRLREHDYSQAGSYFVTICTKDRACLFGEVIDNVMVPDELGGIVIDAWNSLPSHYRNVDVDAFVLMPNHIHGIVVLNGRPLDALGPNSDLEPIDSSQAVRPARHLTLGEVVRAFKARTSTAIQRLRGTLGVSVWQRNYHEHVIRGETSLLSIRQYIANNPARWAMDRENPSQRPKQ